MNILSSSSAPAQMTGLRPRTDLATAGLWAAIQRPALCGREYRGPLWVARIGTARGAGRHSVRGRVSALRALSRCAMTGWTRRSYAAQTVAVKSTGRQVDRVGPNQDAGELRASQSHPARSTVDGCNRAVAVQVMRRPNIFGTWPTAAAGRTSRRRVADYRLICGPVPAKGTAPRVPAGSFGQGP